ncbi:hypothetical protein DFV88_24810 [Salmonella enterica subsp. enterica serovar Newport]|nr:hypothetical protein [Salmonella enterica subsp. enterica serovar Newport]
MSVFDWMNDQDITFGDTYNPTQSNVLGKSLAPINPAGQLSAVDATNDTRTPLQFKQDAQAANRIATNSKDEDENYITSSNGNKYEKVNDSDWHNGLAAAANYISTYFATNGNVGAAGMAAGQAVDNNEQKAHRLSQVDTLEAAGYNSLDIQNWINSGDKKDLVTNKGSWTSGGNGTMFNTLTGETRTIPGAINSNAPVKTVDLGDRKIMYYADGRTEEVAKGATPRYGVNVTGATGGSIGLDEIESGQGPQAFIVDANGGLLKLSGYDKAGNPRYTTANSKDIETYNAQKNAGTPDANTQLVSTDLNTVQSATESQLNRITGQVIGRSTTMRDIASSLDPETRKIYQASERLSTQMGNAAISAAKAAGASGINTEAEIKRFTAGVPQIDYTSEDNYKASVAKIKEYAENFKNQLILNKGGSAPQQQQPAPAATNTNQLSDADLLKKYGG